MVGFLLGYPALLITLLITLAVSAAPGLPTNRLGASRDDPPGNPARAEPSAGLALVLGNYHRLGQFSGTALVARHGREVYRGAFGLASRELNVPHTTETRFAVASINKTFTAMMVLRLADQGKLGLDGVIRDYLPDYPSDDGKRITLRQLLTHTSGMQADIGDFPAAGNDFPALAAKVNGDFYSLDELVALIARRPLAFAPGERWGYSSDGYAVLGAVAAKVWGKPYGQALREMFLEPLAMADSGYVPQTFLLSGRAAGYRQTFDGYENARPMGLTPAGACTRRSAISRSGTGHSSAKPP